MGSTTPTSPMITSSSGTFHSKSASQSQTHRRRRSSVSMSSAGGRRSSQQYGISSSPQTSRRSSRNFGTAVSRTNSEMGFAGNVLGPDAQDSLADELADAWDDEEDEDADIEEERYGEEEEDQLQQQLDGLNHSGLAIDTTRSLPQQQQQQQQTISEDETKQQLRDSGVSVDVKTPSKHHHQGSVLSIQNQRHHSRQKSYYDGSEFDEAVASGTEDSLPASLTSRIDEIAWLASRPDEPASSTKAMATVREESASPPLTVSSIPGLTTSLRDLSTLQQSNLETHTSRLITSHTALATHLAFQTRNMQSLIFPLTSPFSIPPDNDSIDALLPFILATLEALPQPTHMALSSISQLSDATTALLQSLSTVSDSLHMSRETMTVASRRLKSAREAVADLRKEQSADEKGRTWIERGDWDKKLRERDAKRVCGEVVDGFEQVCGAWRDRLLLAAQN